MPIASTTLTIALIYGRGWRQSNLHEITKLASG